MLPAEPRDVNAGGEAVVPALLSVTRPPCDPITFPLTMISTRRSFYRPSAVVPC